MQFAQLGPREDHAVPIDDQIARLHPKLYLFAAKNRNRASEDVDLFRRGTRLLFTLRFGRFAARRFRGGFFALQIRPAPFALYSNAMLLSHGVSYRRKANHAQANRSFGKIGGNKYKSVIAFLSRSRLEKISPVLSSPVTFSATPKTLISASLLLLALATLFGVLNIAKVKTLRSNVTETATARDNAERRRAAQEKEIKGREAAVSAEKIKIAEAQRNVGGAEAELIKMQKEKTDLQAKLQANESEIISLQKQLEEKQPTTANPGAPSVVEMQAQLDDARRQLDSAESEKVFLSEKVQSVQQRSSQLEEEKKRRAVATGKVGVRGTVLAVNQAYNFVVLNLGGRQGVEPHSEMLVLRDGSFIGKIRISSVEPATAIGDIITSSLARGVQVQPGDIVIYAGTNS